MKNVIRFFLICTLLNLASCSSNKDEVVTPVDSGIATTAATGKVYNSNFTFLGGYSHNLNESGVDKLVIYLASQNLNCSNSSANSFPIYFATPKTLGSHTSNTYITFKNLSNGNNVSVTSGVEIIIDSMTSTTVIGRVKGNDLSGQNSINGRFEVPICF